jgi:hypothetical protein
MAFDEPRGASEDEQSIPKGSQHGVATRAGQKAQDEEDESNKITCLDFGSVWYREWKDHGAKF